MSPSVRLWHGLPTMLARRLIDSLYTEAMLLADEVRAYFDIVGREARDTLAPMERVLFSCESLKVTTRLMHVIAWLLTQRAVEVGELSADGARDASRRLGPPVASDATTLAKLPADARRHVEASIDLYARVARIEASNVVPEISVSPARQLHNRLSQAF